MSDFCDDAFLGEYGSVLVERFLCSYRINRSVLDDRFGSRSRISSVLDEHFCKIGRCQMIIL